MIPSCRPCGNLAFESYACLSATWPTTRLGSECRLCKLWDMNSTVSSVGTPTSPDQGNDCSSPGSYSCLGGDITPGIRCRQSLVASERLNKRSPIPTYLSKLESIADQRQGFSHLASHGFKLEERDLLSICLTQYGAAEAIDGFVFRLTLRYISLAGHPGSQAVCRRFEYAGQGARSTAKRWPGRHLSTEAQDLKPGGRNAGYCPGHQRGGVVSGYFCRSRPGLLSAKWTFR